MALSRDALLRLARSGAAARVRELQSELDSIYKTFPDLRGGGRSASRQGARVAASKTGVSKTGPARRKPWSAAERKAVSERMKKYWAARRAKTARKA